MKKVLALVLAVVMVCTMAMAVTIEIGSGTPVEGAGATEYAKLEPGSKLYFTLEELEDDGYEGYYSVGEDKEAGTEDDVFVPANNKVTVTYGKGAELVKSAGWVETNEHGWIYQIVLKDSDTATYDKTTADFSITKVVFKATGENAVEYIYDKDHEGVKAWNYGWATDELPLVDSKTPVDITFSGEGFGGFLPLNTIVTLQAVEGTDGVIKSNVWYMGILNQYEVEYNVAAGQKILRKNFDGSFVDAAGKWAKKYGIDTLNETPTVVTVNDTNLVGAATLTQYVHDNFKGVNFYYVAIDGTVTKAALKVDDGVATFKVPAYSAVIAVEGTLKNVSAPVADNAEVTNPGTGANDVVGVAAALAVVALVSGAAISLKK